MYRMAMPVHFACITTFRPMLQHIALQTRTQEKET